MKKTYINPNIEVVKIATQQMLAGSLNPSAGTGKVNDIDAPDGDPAEGRGTIWDW